VERTAGEIFFINFTHSIFAKRWSYKWRGEGVWLLDSDTQSNPGMLKDTMYFT
jgi:hypothetical protein